MKKKSTGDYDVTKLKTEEMLKQEARQRAEERAVQEASKPPVPSWKKKLENYWYHYKIHTIGGLILLVIVLSFVFDIVNNTKPDATIIMISPHYYGTESLKALEGTIAEYAEDYNADGKISILIDYIHYALPGTEDNNTTLDVNMEYANQMKLTTTLAAGSDPIFLVDDEIYDMLMQQVAGYDDEGNPLSVTDDISFFLALDEIDGALEDKLPFTATLLADVWNGTPIEGLSFCIREKSAVFRPDNAYFDYCIGLLTKISA